MKDTDKETIDMMRGQTMLGLVISEGIGLKLRLRKEATTSVERRVEHYFSRDN